MKHQEIRPKTPENKRTKTSLVRRAIAYQIEPASIAAELKIPSIMASARIQTPCKPVVEPWGCMGKYLHLFKSVVI